MVTCLYLFKPGSFLLLGFRLFSTSVPGKKAEDPPAPVRRRPAPSSRSFIFLVNVFFPKILIVLSSLYDIILLSAPLSDSDDEMEMRLKEAAVSLKDLLPSSALSFPPTESPCSEKIKTKKKATVGGESCVKRKKKRQKNLKDGHHVDSSSTPDAQSHGELTNSEQEQVKVARKKKKKKRREGNTEEEALN